MDLSCQSVRALQAPYWTLIQNLVNRFFRKCVLISSSHPLLKDQKVYPRDKTTYSAFSSLKSWNDPWCKRAISCPGNFYIFQDTINCLKISHPVAIPNIFAIWGSFIFKSTDELTELIMYRFFQCNANALSYYLTLLLKSRCCFFSFKRG